jgi:hypothetical protein
MRTVTLTLALALAAPASAACFDAFVYEDARVILAVLPTTRERAALEPDLAAAYDRADSALVAFLDTEPDRECRDAETARVGVSTAIDDLVDRGVLEAGKCCQSWNTGTGGTTCTDTTETTCPGDLFYCEDGPNGCF